MNRLILTILVLIFTSPVYTHDFTSILYIEGFSIISFLFSLYIVGEGNRFLWFAILLLTWAALWSILYFANNITALFYGNAVLVIIQPIGAILFKKAKYSANVS